MRVYDTKTGAANRAGFRRQAGYWYKTEKVGSAQQDLFAEEERDDLPLVNRLREDVKRWRDADYRGASRMLNSLKRELGRCD
jgi:type III restriction enzyme